MFYGVCLCPLFWFGVGWTRVRLYLCVVCGMGCCILGVYGVGYTWFCFGGDYVSPRNSRIIKGFGMSEPRNVQGVFCPQRDADGHLIFGEYSWHNAYWCQDCRMSGITHEVDVVSHGVTDERSRWGAGLPAYRCECSHCGKWDGPFVIVR